MSTAAPGSRSDGPRRLVIEADGGSRGNPGVAGYGALVRERDSGEVLIELAEPLGRQSNNVAEYSGLIAGLQAVLTIDAGAQVVARLDSKLVVEQMAGRWKIKHEDMRRLALTARELCAQINAAGGSVDFEWVPREKNKAADALSNEAMDGHSVRRVPDDVDAERDDNDPDLHNDSTPEPDHDEPARGPGLRLVLVQHPSSPAQAAQVASAVGRLIAHPRVVGGSISATNDAHGLSAVFERALGVSVENDPRLDAPTREGADPGPDTDILVAYASLVATGGEVVVVTTRRGLLTVISEVLGLPPERFWALASAPGSLSGIEVWPDGTASVAFTNRTDHLG